MTKKNDKPFTSQIEVEKNDVITKEAWEKIESDLSSFHGQAKFEFKENTIQVTRTVIGEGITGLAVYINGKINHAWGITDHEEYRPIVEKIWKKKSMYLYSPAKQKKIVKELGRRKAKEYFKDLEKKLYWYQPVFPKAKPLIAKLKKIEGLAFLG